MTVPPEVTFVVTALGFPAAKLLSCQLPLHDCLMHSRILPLCTRTYFVVHVRKLAVRAAAAEDA